MTVSPMATTLENRAKTRAPERVKSVPTFCVILPMYNEQDSAQKCISGIADFISTLHSRTAIIAVNDGSSDNTLDVLKTLSKTYPNLIVVNCAQNGGYGEANRAGFRAAIDHGFDYALVMDGDGTQHPVFIEQFLRPMMLSYDFIKATRYSPFSRVEGVSFKRRLISLVGNKLAQIFIRVPITDYTNGFRAIKCTLLARMMTKEKGFSMLIEEVVQGKKLGAKFYEVPYTLTARRNGESLSKFVYSLRVYGSYLKHLISH
jgi:dolichol-phosphate mannosyltransferase